MTTSSPSSSSDASRSTSSRTASPPRRKCPRPRRPERVRAFTPTAARSPSRSRPTCRTRTSRSSHAGWPSFLRRSARCSSSPASGPTPGSCPKVVDELGVGDDVRLLGAVAPDDLEALYAQADVLVTATLYEGFGLPVLEAMARGVLVACSDLPVLREVAGADAELLRSARSDVDRSRAAAAALRRRRAADPARGRPSARCSLHVGRGSYADAAGVRRGDRG